MTVDFPPSYPTNTASASKPVDVQTLQETFAALLRSYGTEKGGTQTNTILEVIRPSPSDNSEEKDRNQHRQENQQRTGKTDFTQTDRKLLDKSEMRKGEMSADYQSRSERQEVLRNDHREKVERNDIPIPATQVTTQLSATQSPALFVASPSLSADSAIQSSVPLETSSIPKPDAKIVNANNQSLPVNVVLPNSPASNGQPTVAMPMNINAPVSMPSSVAPPSVPPQFFTVFTPSGRFGQLQEKADENEDEDRDEEKDDKKKTPFAVFESIRLETTRPVKQNPRHRPKESTTQVQRTLGKTHAKPKEVESETSQGIKTMDELLNASPQSIAAPKKGEPDQSQYMKRIAAACEAAAQYAPIRMKINLEHLGTLSLRFSYKADKLALRFETPSKESAQFLRNHLDGLRTILAKRNVAIADIEIFLD